MIAEDEVASQEVDVVETAEAEELLAAEVHQEAEAEERKEEQRP